MEVGAMTAQEWPWVQARSGETGWAQLTPAQQAETNLEAFRGQVRGMLTQALSAPGSSALVAREGGAPVGYLVVSVVPDELTQAPVGLFVDIYVEPAWRGKGVSSTLTAAGERHLRGLGLRQVKRWVAAHNQASLKHAMKDGCVVERVQLMKQL